jgi:hypothetical protein
MNLKFGFDNDFETRSLDREYRGQGRDVTFRSVIVETGKQKRYLKERVSVNHKKVNSKTNLLCDRQSVIMSILVSIPPCGT